MKRIGFAVAMVAIATMAFAVEVPNTFTDGEVASAEDVNENFQALADAINGANYTGDAPINVNQVARTIGLNAATDPGAVLTWDGSNWVSRRLPAAVPQDNMQPYTVLNFIIALQGIFPSRSSAEPFVAQIIMFAGNFAPRGWAFCDGQLLPIAQNTALFALIGTIYGGDGRTTLGLPNLQGRAPLHPGRGPGLSSRTLGQSGGSETVVGGSP